MKIIIDVYWIYIITNKYQSHRWIKMISKVIFFLCSSNHNRNTRKRYFDICTRKFTKNRSYYTPSFSIEPYQELIDLLVRYTRLIAVHISLTYNNCIWKHVSINFPSKSSDPKILFNVNDASDQNFYII